MADKRNTRSDPQQAQTQIDDGMVAKVGAAVGQIAVIRQEYTERLQSAHRDDEREQLAERAQQAAIQAIDDQGISVSDYNEVVSAADQDPELEDRLIMAARAAS